MRISLLLIMTFVFIGGQSAVKGYEIQTIAEDLNFPWCVAFLPNGEYLVSLRPGELRRITSQGDISDAIGNTPETYFASQGGYFDVLLDPDFEQNNTLYLAFAHGTPESNATRIVKARLNANTLEDVTPIFTATKKDTPVHYGGRMALLSDNTLILTVGDGFDYREAAQDTFSHLGKVIRVNTDGSVPSDNPFANGEKGDPKVYAYGLRNQQGLALDAATNTLYLNEHGPQGGDEVNIVSSGGNYGWPVTSYGINYSGAKVSPFETLPGIKEPIKYWTPSIAVSGMTFYTGAAFPEWQGDLLVGALIDKEVRRLELKDGAVVSEETLFQEINQRIRDVRMGPDGMIYILTDSEKGKLLRVIPK
ncbi:MAG: PQQ-dependent sugar dehydrogenase [Pseudomonadota bacterium]